ncbi:MAG: hypothetical protein MSC30_00855 [Gaiellaceae bacterium MAG52_C11]|nr:hypothetical protein [Candidatus Gaiellasilicea maunaloa]
MAEDVTLPGRVEPHREEPRREEEAPLVPTVGADRGERARLTSYRFRFGLVYVILAALVGAAAGAFVVLVSRPGLAPEPSWSSWQPEGSRIARVRQIADRIPKAYKLPSGDQLTVARGSTLAVRTETEDIPVDTVYVRPDTSRGQAEENEVASFDGAATISYGLCGLGTSAQCAITETSAANERFTNLRRQALELSLYTFKYVDDVDSVIVFMPPTPKGESNGSVFLRREDLKTELDRPIRQLLPGQLPGVAGLQDAELANIIRLTEPRIYAYQFDAGPDGKPLLALTPLAAAG